MSRKNLSMVLLLRLLVQSPNLRGALRLVVRVILRIYLRILYGKERRAMIMLRDPRYAISDPYEPEIGKLVMPIRGDLAVDIGASLGQYTVRFAKHFKRVISVEPNPINLPILRQRIRRLKVENVQIVTSAVGDVDGETDLYLNPQNIHGGASIVVSGTSPQFQRPEAGTPIPEHFRVAILKLDTLLLNEPHVDLVKVDAESAEWQILSGAKESLGKIKRWMIELHDLDRMKELDLLLKSSGYGTKWILDWGPSLHVLATKLETQA